MIVLIGDSDEATHYAIRRAVLAELDCEVVKAHTGPDVLDKLQHHSPDALIMDAQIPILDGAEALQILRASPRFASLPVFILTAGMDEPLALRLFTFGLQDIIVKPLSDARLRRLTTRLVEIASRRPRATQPVSRLTKGSSALIVDGDKTYREYFMKAVRGRLAVAETESGAKALEVCHRTHPDVVFLGTDLGLVDRAQVAQRLRALPSYGAVRIVAIPQKSEVDAERASGLFDDVMVRTYAPAAFERELARWLRVTTPFERLNALIPDIRVRVIRAVEQVFGTMLGTDVEPGEGPSDRVEARATASVTVTPPPSAVTLRVRFGIGSGREIAAAFLEADASSVPDDDILAVAGEVANVLGGRLKVVFQEHQLETVMGLPVLRSEREGPPADLIQPEHGVDMHFRAVDRPVLFQVLLTVEESEATSDASSADAPGGVATIRTDSAA